MMGWTIQILGCYGYRQTPEIRCLIRGVMLSAQHTSLNLQDSKEACKF